MRLQLDKGEGTACLWLRHLKNRIKAGVTESCLHMTEKSVSRPIKRLDEAGYPMCVVRGQAQKLLKCFKQKKEQEKRRGKHESSRNIAVILYIHVLLHWLKKVGTWYKTKVAFFGTKHTEWHVLSGP